MYIYVVNKEAPRAKEMSETSVIIKDRNNKEIIADIPFTDSELRHLVTGLYDARPDLFDDIIPDEICDDCDYVGTFSDDYVYELEHRINNLRSVLVDELMNAPSIDSLIDSNEEE